MTRRITNTDIARQIGGVDERLKKVETKMQTFHDYMIVQKALNNPTRKKDGSVNWQKVLEKGLTFLIISASSVYILIEFFVKRGAQ